MSPEELGFERIDLGDGDYYFAHKFGTDLEVALEPVGVNRYYLTLYQNRRLLVPKQRVLLHYRGLILIPIGEK